MIADDTPVIIGVGQFSHKVTDPDYTPLSYADLGGRALAEAISDTSASGGTQAVADAINALAVIRAFEMSRADRKPPFGAPDNVPAAFAARVAANPERLILSPTGGQTNQQMLGEFAADIAEGRIECAAIVGAEAISTVLALSAKGEAPDWSEQRGGECEDRGLGVEGLMEMELFAHGATGAIPLYALAENARRAKLGLSLEEYRLRIGELFEPFTRVAAENPHAAAPQERSAEELATITARNRIVAEPYTRMTVARDQVNQAAAIIIASASKARALGVPESQWVHIHSVTSASELKLIERPALEANPASIASVEAALEMAHTGLGEIDFLDFYSCFAIPVFNQCDHFGLAIDDPRGLTLTGGLPFFGGAGNNYSAHAICEAVARVRANPGKTALVGANGGWMSKYSTGIYSTTPADWSDPATRVRALAKASNGVPVCKGDFSEALVETYTINRNKGGDVAVFIGRTPEGERVAGNADLSDEPTRALFEGGEPFGERLTVTRDGQGRNIGRLA
ncbi:acetyl-CoA acetyltransferase [Erythrobacter sp. SCSIO 43205]|uniref:acetyl-CoA acetyltransferase n=1 Tax=Erythrobacter sp. SCSIO 43205 TaxID=2779361 RepID=UPI001CA98B85|nr:acetyl-CoA acetyltransferase [Erythrobacter sp. SCSIO 43205]UAB78819.1 acetyl-CoA acetyltransferase [Erythrobacter sp. SCSIO 43205]